MIERFPGERRDSTGRHRRGARGGRGASRALGVAGPVIGISPGAAYGDAKRWLPERFAESGRQLGRHDWGHRCWCSARRRNARCARPWRRRCGGRESMRETWPAKPALREFIDLAAACRVFLTNDSGAMHVASALGVPTVAVFGATDDTTTGPTGPLARVVREHAECSPCLLRECPIDHRCMTRVDASARVDSTAATRCCWSSTRTRNGYQNQNREPRRRRRARCTRGHRHLRRGACRGRSRTGGDSRERRRTAAAGGGVCRSPDALLPQRARAELVARYAW